LAWVIAVSPIVLMLLALAVGLWPDFIVLVATCLIILALAWWDSRQLDRELLDVAWFWALLGPAPYLFVRSATTRRGLAAAITGTVASVIWIFAIVGGLIAAAMSTPAYPTSSLGPALDDFADAQREFTNSQALWASSNGTNGTEQLQADARFLSAQVDALRIAIVNQEPSTEFSDELVALTTSMNALAAELTDIANAYDQADLARQQCEAAISSYVNDQAFLRYLSAADDPLTPALARSLSVSEAGATFCEVRLPFLDALNRFDQAAQDQDWGPEVRSAYATYAADTNAALEMSERIDVPPDMEDKVSTVHEAYRRSVRHASQVVRAIDDNDPKAARKAARDMTRSLSDADNAEVALWAAWLSYARP
jgi:hypothetical protein